MAEGPKLIFGPHGELEKPGAQRIDVMLPVEYGHIRMELPAPGVLAETDNRVEYMRNKILEALDQLRDAVKKA
jgi:hypothetical protein